MSKVLFVGFKIFKIDKKKLTFISIVIMIIIFLGNLLVSTEYNLPAIFLSGGGNLVDYLGITKNDVFERCQLYRLITYGFTQSSIIHLLANITALWFVGGFFESNIGRLKGVIIYLLGLILPGCLLIVIYPNSLNYGASPAIFTYIEVLVNWALREKSLWRKYKEQIGAGYVAGYFFLSNVIGVAKLLLPVCRLYIPVQEQT